MRSFFAFTLPVMLALPTLAPGCSSQKATAGSPSLQWSACYEQFECAKLDVPVDYAKEAGAKVGIQLLRIAAESPDERIGSLLINPGGPGGAMVDRLVQTYPTLRLAFPEVSRRFDLIAFDWRGVGKSAPIDCADDALIDSLRATDLSMKTPAAVTAADQLGKTFRAGCDAHADPALLESVHTVNAARDLDRVRAALGTEKLNYIGFSYGTWLGATYATLFPDRVGAFAFDAAVAPFTTLEEGIERHAKSYELGLTRFFDACSRDKTCAFHGGTDMGTIAGAYDALLAKVDAAPKGLPAGARLLSSLDASVGVIDGLRAAEFQKLGAALAAAEAGDGSMLLARADGVAGRKADGTYDNAIEGLLGIACLEQPLALGASLQDFQIFVTGLRAKWPRTTSAAVMPWALCVGWPHRLAAAPAPISAKGAAPVLVVGAKYDPITSYDQAETLISAMGNGSYLLTYEGDGHAASFRSACVRTVVSDFLIDPKAPSKTTCPQE